MKTPTATKIATPEEIDQFITDTQVIAKQITGYGEKWRGFQEAADFKPTVEQKKRLALALFSLQDHLDAEPYQGYENK